jgi:predicted  nucleic acid-binding Zn-ribbon protein
MAVLFDTLKLAERLEAAGMPPEQAKGTAAALAEGLTDTVATAADIEMVRGEIREAELRLRGEITELRGEVHKVEARLRGEITELRGEVHGVEARLRGEIATVRTEVANLRAELIRWVVGTGAAAVLAIVGAVAALIKLIH